MYPPGKLGLKGPNRTGVSRTLLEKRQAVLLRQAGEPIRTWAASHPKVERYGLGWPGTDGPQPGRAQEQVPPRGLTSRRGTGASAGAKMVEAEPVTIDHYGRTVAFVRVGDTLVNEELIRQGLAWVFTR